MDLHTGAGAGGRRLGVEGDLKPVDLLTAAWPSSGITHSGIVRSGSSRPAHRAAVAGHKPPHTAVAMHHMQWQ